MTWHAPTSRLPCVTDSVEIQRALIVGLGSIGARHLRLIRHLLPLADIRVLRRESTDVLPEGASGCFSDMEQALAFAPQVAVVATPSPFHLGAAMLLARQGVHLLVEKPLSNDVQGVDDLIALCQTQRVVLMTGYNMRYMPSLNRFRDLVLQAYVGRALSVRCEVGQYLPSWRPGVDHLQSVSANKALGGGALLELSHELDYLRWIFGEVAWINASLSQQSNLTVDVEDTAHLIFGFLAYSGARQLVGRVDADMCRHDTTRMCTVIGESGSLRWNGLSGTVEVFTSEIPRWQTLFEHQHMRDESYLSQLKCFFACVQEGSTPLVSGEDGLGVLRWIDACRRSSDSGKTVHL